MSEEKDLVDRLGDLIKDLPASFQGPVVEARGEIVHLRERVSSQAATINTINVQRSNADKAAADLQADNDMLRDRLYAAELEGARLAGYQDRVNEFDPVSEHAQYEDRLPRPRRSNDNYYDGMAMAAEQRPAWYHRRRA